MRRKRRCYIAGALTADSFTYLANCHRMIQTAERLRRFGYSVYVPCLDVLMAIMFGNATHEAYSGNSLPWLEAADFVCLVPESENGDSVGTQREIGRAVVKGIPIYETPEEAMAKEPTEIEEP